MRSSDTSDEQSRANNLSVIEPITMRIPEACRFTGIGRSTLYLLIANHEVEIIKLGASTLVVTESLRRMIESKRSAMSAASPQI
jgi:excisionase family DNA binding protein